MKVKQLITIGVCALLLAGTQVQAQDVPVKKVIDTIKNMNFKTMTLGIISNGVSDDIVQQLTDLQTELPRSMQIFITQSKDARDVFVDFTFLVNDKKADAILVWPSKDMNIKSVINKICMMSKQKKVPVLAMNEAWLEKGAAAWIQVDDDQIKITENSVITKAMDFPIADKPSYSIVQK